MNKTKIADMANEERPVERLYRDGVQALSDAELLAVILRTGSKQYNVVMLSQVLLNSHPIHKGLAGLNYRYPEEMCKVPGIGKVKAAQIAAITEISRRMVTEKAEKKLEFSSVDTVADYFMEQLRYLKKERLYALFLRSDNSLIHKVLISEGSLNRCMISPGEVFKEALRCNACSIILVHNHPSGNPSPSDEDILVTKKIINMGNELGIQVYDHIIIGNGIYFSMLQEGIFV